MTEEIHSVWMQECSWTDVEVYLTEQENPTVIVPIGSTEQHGPHLPLGVDAYEAIGIAEGFAERKKLLVAPPIWYGDAEHHLAFPGSFSLSSETVIAVLNDVYRSLIHHGFENIITVNGHRLANLPAIQIAAKQTKESHPEAFLATIDLVRFGVRIHNDVREGDPEDGMHGGEFETSYMLYRHPELVDEDEFVPETSDGWTRFTSNDYVSMDDTILIASSKHDWNEEALGHHGDPTKASAEKGEKIHNTIVDNAAEFYDELMAMRARQASNDDESMGLTY